MNKPLPEILNAIPPKPPRSKLEPYYDLIRELRRRSKTYREIAQILEEHAGLRVDHSTIFNFVHVRSRQAKAPYYTEELPSRHHTDSMPPPKSEDEQEPSFVVPSDGADDAHARIEALKRRKEISKPADTAFRYEENAPLRLVSDPNE